MTVREMVSERLLLRNLSVVLLYGNISKKNGPVQEKIARSMIKDLLEGLIPMHAQGVIHRDINPENIMISGDGVLKLIDFGIARTKKENQNMDTTILGTAGYAAPEQFGFGQTDERSDIYAVGVLMNVLLVGQLPNVQRYSGMLQGVMERCLCMDASKRFQSAQELYAVLMRIDSQDTDGMNGYRALEQESHGKMWWRRWDISL